MTPAISASGPSPLGCQKPRGRRKLKATHLDAALTEIAFGDFGYVAANVAFGQHEVGQCPVAITGRNFGGKHILVDCNVRVRLPDADRGPEPDAEWFRRVGAPISRPRQQLRRD